MTASWCGRRAASAISLQPKSRQATCSTSPVPDEKVACVLDHSDNQQNSTTVQPLEDAHHPSFQHRQPAIARSYLRRDPRPSRGSARGRSARLRECDELRSEEHTSELQSLAYLVCR